MREKTFLKIKMKKRFCCILILYVGLFVEAWSAQMGPYEPKKEIQGLKNEVGKTTLPNVRYKINHSFYSKNAILCEIFIKIDNKPCDVNLTVMHEGEVIISLLASKLVVNDNEIKYTFIINDAYRTSSYIEVFLDSMPYHLKLKDLFFEKQIKQ